MSNLTYLIGKVVVSTAIIVMLLLAFLLLGSDSSGSALQIPLMPPSSTS
ncbi:MAG: hypothetical protein P8I38_08845 [Arenicella sp.]|nr:hypothetical protein [Arenicella sp.]